MRFVRALVFLVVVVTLMFSAAVLCLPVLLISRRAGGAITRWCAAVIVVLLRLICGVEVRLTGLAHLENGPVLIAAKHQSALETYVLSNRLPNARFVLKREILMVPLIGWYIRGLEPIAIDRGAGASALRGMVKRARAAVEEGHDVVIFPEGTRTKPGAKAPYHPGAAALYGELGIPVVPVALDTGHVWTRSNFIRSPGQATIAFLEPIPPGLPRREFMALLQQRIEDGCKALESAHQPH